MVNEDPDAEQPREELVPGWHVPGRTRYDYDVRIGDAERDATMVQLREHFVAGRLRLDELTERIDAALTARTQRQIDALMADLPRPPRTARSSGGSRGSRVGPAVAAQTPDPGRFLVFAMLLFALATWILIMAWMSRHAWSGPYPTLPRRLADRPLADRPLADRP
jgi:hypothetical protein